MGTSSSQHKNHTKTNKQISSEDNVVQYSPPKITPTNTGEKKDRSFYVQSNKTDETITRSYGDLSGNPFNCSQLNNCRIIVEDYCDSMMIDKCENCNFILSAIRGSIFVRSCKNCNFLMVCGQFRCVNCNDCNFLMHSKTGPVIESSSKVKVGCSNIGYEKLLENMQNAQLDRLVNKWTDVHDFTPAKDNFELVDEISNLNCPYEQEKPILPFTVTLKHSRKHFFVKLHKNQLEDVIALSNIHHIFVSIEAASEKNEINCLVCGQSKNNVSQIFNSLNPITIKKRKT